MGFKCPLCNKDFGPDRDAFHKHIASCNFGLAKTFVDSVIETCEKKPEEEKVEPEYLARRCCMCPNDRENERENVCPGITGSPHPEASPCRFVKGYIDERGWKYMVMSGIGENTFKARYQKAEKSGSNGWKGLAAVPWRTTFDEAQADLNLLAKKKGWLEWEM